MFTRIRFACTFALAIVLFLITPKPSSGQERLCDPSFEDCYSPLLDLVNSETVGIDMAFYMIELPGLANALISRHQAGVPVRIIVEPRANLKFPGNQPILDQFNAAGIPMRYKLGDGIVHVKMMLLAGQNKVVFTGSNFGDGDVRPYEPYANYVDGAWYISDDPSVVNSFKTRYDDVWTDTATYGNYANINGALTRKYPTHPIDPAMNFLPNQNQSQDYGARTIAQIDQEIQKIDLTMYRVTDVGICDALLRALGRGVQVRLLAEPHEYRFDASRLGAELTGPYNVDRLHTAGVQIKMRKHRGLNHQKSVSLYGRGLTIFGSSNWSWQSFNYQEEHNYFTTKVWFFDWFVNQFNRKWNSAIEYEPFVPLPPTAPVNISPVNLSTTGSASVTLTWEGGRWAHKYDIYLGPNPDSLPLIAADVVTGTLGPSGSESYQVSGLQTGITYYWRIIGKTMANQTATGPVWRFTTSGTTPPSPTVSAVSPNSGTTSGGTSVTITGANFQSGATVRLGGTVATSVNVANSTTITAVTAAHGAGVVDVVVTNTDTQSGTLSGGYTYTQPAPCSFAISRTSQLFPLEGGTGSFTITTGNACNWQAVSEDEWIDITSATSYTGAGIISFTVNPNDTGIPRVGRIVAGGNAYTITQEGLPDGQCQYFITPTSSSFSAAGGSDAVRVTTESRCAWQATSNDSWITFPSANIGIGNGTVTYTLAPNTTGAMRRGTITVAGRTFTVKQKG